MTKELRQLWNERRTDGACLCVLEDGHCINSTKCRLHDTVDARAGKALVQTKTALNSFTAKIDAVAAKIERNRADQKEESDPIKVDFLIEFCRSLIRNNPNGDTIYLAFLAARKRVSLTDDEAKAFLKAVGVEMGKSHWPKGFF